MTNAILTKFNNKKSHKHTKKENVQNVLNVMAEYKMPKRTFFDLYNDLNPAQQIPHATFYYKLKNTTFTETELNRINIIVKYIQRNAVK